MLIHLEEEIRKRNLISPQWKLFLKAFVIFLNACVRLSVQKRDNFRFSAKVKAEVYFLGILGFVALVRF